MTKLRIISDLHREYSDWNYTPQGEDIILIAGDVFSGNRYGILEKLAAQTYPTPTYLVAGNHEFYDKDVKEQWEAIRAFERKHPHMKWLENEFVDFPTFRLWGATLWTDFALNGEYDQKRAMDLARNEIGDFSSILDRGSMLHPRTLLHWNFESRYLLEEQVKESPLPLVVMTHFCPSRRTIDPAYEGQRILRARWILSLDLKSPFGCTAIPTRCLIKCWMARE